MAKKIKLTRNELKAQKEALKRFTRFLPTLELKKLQLEIERRKAAKEILEMQQKMDIFREKIQKIQKLFAENYPKSIDEMVVVNNIVTHTINIAGISIEEFDDIECSIENYDLLLTAPWVDSGIEIVQEIIRLRERMRLLHKKEQIITLELRRTTQRINLFKERLIPECKSNIRKIQIQMGDLQAAAVGRSKIAKNKSAALSQ